MRKGERTRERILQNAAGLFNQRGYASASLQEVLDAAEIEKGGFYNHFSSKEELNLAAFEYARDLFWTRLLEKGADAADPLDRLKGILAYFESQLEAPLLPGGCPFLNASVEADAAPSPLRKPARRAMRRLLRLTEAAFVEARENGALRKDIRAKEMASFWIAALEGAVMLSMIFGARRHVYRVTSQLHRDLVALQKDSNKKED